MAAERTMIHAGVDSELAEALRTASEARKPIFINTGDVVYEVHVHAIEPIERFNRDKPHSILDIAGLGASGSSGSIADHKDEYIADAYDVKRR
ncbi:MAG TPA: hypothetical protein VFV93_05175 [Thermomicrobiales bacterium]|nr:hypothetical protein [Thermomicrobiales bacterium]